VRHESPQEFEIKWYVPYEIVEKMLFGTYRLQDPNGKELVPFYPANTEIVDQISQG
jgi:hypothetical protein